MATFDDAKRDAADLAKLVNEDTDVTTRYGTNPKVSAPKAIRLIEASGAATVNQIQNDAANAIATLNTSRGFRVVGDFASGFTYELPNDVAIDGSGNYWVYADVNALPVVVTAGTTPSAPTYTQVTFNQAAGVTTTAGINTQQFIDNFELKIFQSPTDNLTKVSTFAGGVGVVYEVRKTSDNSLATIYSDKDGVTEIVQDGIVNVSNGNAEASFYIADGAYTVTINAVSAGFVVARLQPFKAVAAMKAANLQKYNSGTRIEWQGYYQQSDGGSNWGFLKFGAHTEDGFSIFSIDANTYVEANLKGKSRLSIRKAGAKSVAGFDNSDITNRVIQYAFIDGNRKVWIPPSADSFECLSSIILRRGSHLVGADGKQTDPRFDGNVNSSLYFPNAGIGVTADQNDSQASYIWSIAVDGVSIKGNRVAGSVGIEMDQWAFAKIKDVSVDRFDDGIRIKRGMKNTFVDTTVEFCESRCIYFNAIVGVTTTQHFTRCEFRAAPTLVDIESITDGYHIQTVMTECLFESPEVRGIKLDKSCSLILDNCYFENVPNDTLITNGVAISAFLTGSNTAPSESILWISKGLLAGGNQALFTDSALLDVGDCASVVVDSVQMKRATHGIRIDPSVGYGVITLVGQPTQSGITNFITGNMSSVSGFIPNASVGSPPVRGHLAVRGRIDFVNGGGAVGEEIGQEITWANSINESVGAAIGAVRESGAQGAGKLVFKTSNNDSPAVDRWQINQAGNFQSVTDNTYNIGSAGLRVKEIFAANGTINTSDAREKTEIATLTSNELNAAAQLSKEVGGYKWLASVSEKGELARYHIGITVQRAMDVMESHNLDPLKYGFICYDKWDSTPAVYANVVDSLEVLDKHGAIIKEATYKKVVVRDEIPAGDRYGFRYSELIMFIVAGINHRLELLEI